MPPSPHEIHPQRLEQLAVFLRERDQILADWDAYHEQHTDLDDWPYDAPAYIERAGHRDAAMWKAFNRVRPTARELLATAGMQLQRLPAKSIQSRWVWQLGVLHSALDHLAALQEEWLATRDSLPPSARPGTWLYDDERAQRNAEAAHYIDEWASAGETVLEIHQAAQQTPSPLTITPPVPAPAPLVSASRTTRARL
ncbi:hypothetical protein GCM10010416_27510 [Streptomyces caniferus]|uniref:hypothetical protein n=1 Tax=Streptomyces caniferus TaxID=285557 RepID=UPI0031D95282